MCFRDLANELMTYFIMSLPNSVDSILNRRRTRP
jgi:hypothetical protein